MKIRGSLARIPGPQLLSRLRDFRRAAVVVWVSAAVACSADGTGIAASGTLNIALSRDSVLTVGRDSTALLTVDVRGADGTRSPISGDKTLIVYTISDTSVVEFANPLYAYETRQLHPKKSGVASITVTADGMSSTTSVRVVDDRPVVTPELGTVVQGVVQEGIGAVRYAFDLRAGDTVDMRAEGAYLRQVSGPVLTRKVAFNEPTTYAAVAVSQTARYEFDGVIGVSCIRGGCQYVGGGFTFTIRRAGPVFAVTADSRGVFALPFGGRAADTIWVHNVGRGSLTARATSAFSFLLADSVVTALGPVAVPVGIVHSSGAVPIAVRVDASSTPLGWHDGGVRITLDPDVWHTTYMFNGDTLTHLITMNVFDASLRIIRSQYFNAISAASAEKLFAVDGGFLYAIRVADGQLTKYPIAAHEYTWVSATSDGLALVAYSNVLAKLQPDSSLQTLATYSGAFAAAADGTVFIYTNNQVIKRTSAGTTTTLATLPGSPRGPTMAYSEQEHALYYTRDGVLRRLDVATGAEEARGSTPDFWPIAADDEGRLYGRTLGAPDVAIYDVHGKALGSIAGPGTTSWVAVYQGMMFGCGPPQGGTPLWVRGLP